MFPDVPAQFFRRLLAGWFGLAVAVASAQEANNAWLIRSWQSEDGLPNNTVDGLAQTADGFIWIGSPKGLARFDGLNFENYSLTNLVSPDNRGVVTMLRSRAGGLWLGMARGEILYLDGRSWRRFAKEPPNKIPSGMAEDDAGGLWVSYRDGSVYRLKDGTATPFSEPAGLPPGADTCALTTDKQGDLWFAKAGQVGKFSDGAFHTRFHLAVQPMCLASAQDGGVWLGCGCRLYKCEPGGGLKDCGAFEPVRSGTAVETMLEDRTGAVWLGTSFSGLYRYDPMGFGLVTTTQQRVFSLMEDNEGSIWAGSIGGGLNRLRRRAIRLETVESGLSYPALLSICEDATGSLWAATVNEVLVRCLNDRWSEVPVAPEMPAGIISVAADKNGLVWVGTRHGLYCGREGHFEKWDEKVGIPGKIFHSLLVSQAGDVWVGQEIPGAILRLRAGRLSPFPISSANQNIRAMTEDAAGNIWAATSKGTLFRVAGDQLTEMTPHRPTDLVPIRSLSATPDGAVWIGYSGGGLGCFKNGQYAEFNLAQGLFDDYISQIVLDNQGWLWLGADRGIFKVREQDLLNVMAGKLPQVRSVHYGRSDGLPSLQATFGSSPNVLRSHDGQLWFPMQTALAVVNPSRLNKLPAPPPPLILRVKMDDQPLAEYGGTYPVKQYSGNQVADLADAKISLRLPPAHRRLEVEFAALSFYAPENVQFRYRLKGFENEWIEAGARRSVIYSRLPAGKYFFEMTARNSDGDWNPRVASLSFVVTPFYWQTWWFRLGGLAAFTLSAVITVRYVLFRRLRQKLHRLEQQAALQKERARIAKDIHDDLGANLAQIAYLGELAQLDRHEPDKSAEHIGKMSTTARKSIKSLDEIVWAVNPRNDTLAHLLDYVGQFALDYLRLAGLRVRLDFPEQVPARDLSTDLRHNIFLAVKEALHNIVKHAGATEVWLRAAYTDQALEISVEDNGRGFARAPDNALADGLRNMRERLADIRGECHILNPAAGGTKVILHLPWPAQQQAD